MINAYKYDTNIGILTFVEEEEKLLKIEFGDTLENYNISETKLIKQAYKEVKEYLDGKRVVFEVPLNLKGTKFMIDVWNQLKTIPYGKTATYKDIAIKINNPKACRAVGMANNKNSIPIIIPCHRVIGTSGKLVGYAGGLDIKKKLLSIEGIEKIN